MKRIKVVEYRGRELGLHRAIVDPIFGEKTILIKDSCPWDYIDLWLSREGHKEAALYWRQSREFYNATKLLSKESSPLTAYYCLLNATKALLSVKKGEFDDQSHGVTGRGGHQSKSKSSSRGKKFHLKNENIKVTRGVFLELCGYLGEGVKKGDTYSLKDVLYNLPYIHRAFDLTYKDSVELFVPISSPKIMKDVDSSKAYLSATLTGRFARTNTTENWISNKFKLEEKSEKVWTVRHNLDFDWNSSSIENYQNYHKNIRKDFSYIHNSLEQWYVKKDNNKQAINQSTITLAFMAMHNLSEIARYYPQKLSLFFNSKPNWLLSEFIASAPDQFINEISCELTGCEFLNPSLVHSCSTVK